MLKLQWSKLLPLNKEIIESIPSASGVYRLSYKSAEGAVYVFFIGNSDKSLKDTILSHLNSSETNVCIKTYLANLQCFFKYAEIKDDEERKNCEKSLYAHYSPKCNINIPSGNIVDVNFN